MILFLIHGKYATISCFLWFLNLFHLTLHKAPSLSTMLPNYERTCKIGSKKMIIFAYAIFFNKSIPCNKMTNQWLLIVTNWKPFGNIWKPCVFFQIAHVELIPQSRNNKIWSMWYVSWKVSMIISTMSNHISSWSSLSLMSPRFSHPSCSKKANYPPLSLMSLQKSS